jgi:hypothetical protein
LGWLGPCPLRVCAATVDLTALHPFVSPNTTLDEAAVFTKERPFDYGIDLASADLPDYHYGEPQLARDSAS